MEKEFWRRITRDEIITDYNTKAVNVDAYQKRDNNSDTAGKGYKRNPTTDEQFILKARPDGKPELDSRLDWTGRDWTGLGGDFFLRVGARVVLFYDLITQNPRPGYSAKPKL